MEPEAELRFTPGHDNPFSHQWNFGVPRRRHHHLPNLPKRLTNPGGGDRFRKHARRIARRIGHNRRYAIPVIRNNRQLQTARHCLHRRRQRVPASSTSSISRRKDLAGTSLKTRPQPGICAGSGENRTKSIQQANNSQFMETPRRCREPSKTSAIKRFAGEYNYENGRLDYRNLSLQTCEGVLEGGGAYTFTKGEHGLSTQFWASGIDIAHLTRFPESTIANPPRGHLDGSLHLAAQGSNWDEFQQSLQGSLRSRLHGGRIPGIHMAQLPSRRRKGLSIRHSRIEGR